MDLLHSIFSNIWSTVVVMLFLGGSIFVHELGHFLAARRRGMHITRFSIGFGPKIFSWIGKDGVEYRLSWIPLGGYVALPQLADMSAIEGESGISTAKLPPITFTTKFIVAVAGACFNILFAFLLACILTVVGINVAKEDQTTQVGVVLPEIELSNGEIHPGPAFTAGIKAGDTILSVDGKSVNSLTEIGALVALGSGRGSNYEPKVDIVIQRDGQTLPPITVFPLKVGSGKYRDIGVEATSKIFVDSVIVKSAAYEAGLKPNDLITHLDDQPVRYQGFIRDYLRKNSGRPVHVTYVRNNETNTITVTPKKTVDPDTHREVYRLGISMRGEYTMIPIHMAPWTLMWQNLTMIWHNLVSLISPHSDIGLSKMSGIVEMAERMREFAKFDLRLVLLFTVIINISLAVFNLLPIPVLDGGHILFAVIAKIRGHALPAQLIVTTQSVFMVLLFSLMLYVNFFGICRIFDIQW